MPAITSGKVLVTGANGYIGVWIVKLLLEAGFSVRGTVRSESKTKHLYTLFAAFGDKLELVIVADITQTNAFVPHVADVDAVLHTASPFHMNAVEPDEIIKPAVGGAVAVLKAVQTHGSAVKRVVVISSTAALISILSEPVIVDETAWNEEVITEVKEKGRDARAAAKYCASKTLAEKAAWEWYEENKGKVQCDLVCLNPPFVYGPVLNEVDRPEHLSQSTRDWYNNIVKGELDNAALADLGHSYVDVRDIARAHVLALQKSDIGGERIIVSAGPYKWQDFVNAARHASDKIPVGNTSYDPTQTKHLLNFENKKSIKLLGMRYYSIEETTRDMVEDFEARNWL